jgi:hypothetical protein
MAKYNATVRVKVTINGHLPEGRFINCVAAKSEGAMSVKTPLFLLFLALPVVSQSAGPWDASLIFHSESLASELNAYCLDGSRGGMYVRRATSDAGRTKFKIHFQGGGWATTPASLLSRSQSILGSSSTWTPYLSSFWPPEYAGFSGLMGLNDTSVSPFGDWNMIWLVRTIIAPARSLQSG